MAELFRIKCKRNKDWYGDDDYWTDKHGEFLFTDKQLRKNVDDVPEGIKRMELVAHDRPAVDRFVCKIRKDDIGMYVATEVSSCDEIKEWIDFLADSDGDDAIDQAIRKCRLKAGDVIHVQVEC